MLPYIRKPETEVLNHWIALSDGFQLASGEFYASVEDELTTLQVPGLDLQRVEFAEGGLLSQKRVYLRMMRERLVFDVCAAPFGTSFFFSCRTAVIPAVIQLWQLIALAALLMTLVYLLWRFAGFWNGSALFVVGLAALVYTLRNAVAMGLHDLDAALVKSPLFGPIYERLFRKETYYRQDTRLIYLEIVGSIVKKLAEDAVAAKGLKLVRQFEQSPILGELYRPVPSSPRATEPK